MIAEEFKFHTISYLSKLRESFDEDLISSIYKLNVDLKEAWVNKNNIFICGNGGSGANANHIANDLLYGVGYNRKTKKFKHGMRVESLVANSGVLTCLANDIDYKNVFSKQLEIKANPSDFLIALSGSGNSPNIVEAIELANKIGLKTTAVVGFDGGNCKNLAQNTIHSKVNDMEVAEDIQMIIFNICKQWLINNPP